MRRARLNFWVDGVLFALLVLLVATGALMKWVLPKGMSSLFVWGLGRHDWGAVHFWIAVAALVALVLHTVLHWGWIVEAVRGGPDSPRGRARVAAGLAAVAVPLALAVAPLLSPVRGGGSSEGHEREGAAEGGQETAPAPQPGTPQALTPGAPVSVCSVESDTVEVHGSMSLEAAARATGVPAEHLILQLRLPSNVSRTTPLRDLRGQHGFTMDDVRRVVREYLAARC